MLARGYYVATFTVEQLLDSYLLLAMDASVASVGVFHRLTRTRDANDFGMERLLDEQLAFDSYLYPSNSSA